MLDRKSNKLSPLGALVMGALAVMAQSNVARADDAAGAQKLEKIEVTGSSIKRTVEDETALPVQIITRQDIARSGVQNTEDLLRQISATSTAGATQVSSGSGATSSGVSTVSLRGLGSTRTLVLLNGRRTTVFGGVPGGAGDSSVDINSIPIAAIERIEVLKDGASAIYGSDAIAGVINFVLRKNYEGGEVSATYGDTLNGGAGSRKFNGVYGFGDLLSDKYNVLLGINAQKDGALYGKDRSFANSAIAVDATGATNSSASSNTFPANVLNPSISSRNPLAPNNCSPSVATSSGLACQFDPGPYVALLPGSERVNLFANFNGVVNDHLSAYGELGFGRNKTSYTIQPSPVSYQFTVPLSNPYTTFLQNYIASHPGLSTVYGSNLSTFQSNAYATPLSLFVPPGSPYYQQALSALTSAQQSAFLAANSPVGVKFRSFINGLRSLQDVAESTRAVAGLKGDALGWDFDVNALYTQSKVTETPTSGYFSQSGFASLFDSGVINPFGPSPANVVSQVQALNVSGDAFSSKTSLAELGAKATREIYTLPAGAVSAAVGASLRQDKFEFNSSQAIQSGDVSGYGGNFLPVSKTRNVEAAFGELEVPITKTVTGDLAVRYENYEGVGNTTTPKASLRWQPEKNFLVRSSYGKGFRAPSLTDLYGPSTQGVSPVLGANSDPLRCPVNPALPECASSYQFTTHNGGNANLKPEKSENFTLGVVWEPTKDSVVSLDYYKIRLNNAITLGGLGAVTLLSSANYAQKYAQFIVRGAPDGNGAYGPIQYIDQTNQNLFNTITDGVDVDMHWKVLANETGRYTVGLNGSYIHRYDIQQPDGTYIGTVDNAYNGYTLNTSNLVSRWRYTATLNWDTAQWATTVAYNYQKSYTDAAANFGANTDANGNPILPSVPAVITVDLQTSYTGIPNWVITAGARNLFNYFPPYSNIGGQSSFQSGYDPSYGDPRGRFMYATVTYRWK